MDQLERMILDRVGSAKFNVWFRNTTRFEITGDHLRVLTPNRFVGDWIERHFHPMLAEAAESCFGRSLTLCYAIDPELARIQGRKQPDRQVDDIAQHAERQARRSGRGAPPPTPELRGRIEDFVVGPSNEMAFAAARVVIHNPGTRYNPLFIHGGCGVGKSHLLQAICNEIRRLRPELHWRYVTGEEFTNDYVYAVKAREQDAFRQRYRTLDLLVIDDVHFLANKRATQEEFLHTFNAIDVPGKQVILASDAPPKLIGHFSQSLVSRFLSGMVVRIDTPDVDTRAEVLRRRAHALSASVPEAAILHIAERFCTNIRELEGAMLKVVALGQTLNQPVTVSLAERAIRDLVRQNVPVVKLSDIESIVAIFFGLNPVDLHTSRKSRTIALARGITMYLARKHTRMSYPEIGRFMGNKNHSTVILAARRISAMLQRNEKAVWLTPAGQREQDLAILISEIEEQFVGKPAAWPVERSNGFHHAGAESDNALQQCRVS